MDAEKQLTINPRRQTQEDPVRDWDPKVADWAEEGLTDSTHTGHTDIYCMNE